MQQYNYFHPPNYKPRVVFRTTSRCNYRCRICFWGRPEVAEELQRNDETMPMELFQRVLRDALPFCSEISLADGGEFLSDPFYEERMTVLANELRNYPEIRFNQNTNGSMLTKERLSFFRGIQRVGFMVSIDSVDYLNYASIRKPGTLSTVQENISNLRNNLAEVGISDLKLQLNAIITKRNIFNLPAMLHYSNTVGADLFIDHPQGFGPDDLYKESLFNYPVFSNAFLAKCQELATVLNVRLFRPPPFAISNEEILQCNYTDDFKNDHCLQLDNYGPVSILANGEYSVCCLGLIFGNVNSQSFKEIFFSDNYLKYREAISSGHPLSPCNNCRWLHRYTSPYLFDSAAYQMDIPVESRNLELEPDFVKEGFFDWVDELSERRLRSELKQHYLAALTQLTRYELDDKIDKCRALEPLSEKFRRRFYQYFAALESRLVRWARSRKLIMDNLWVQKTLINIWEVFRRLLSARK